MPSALSSFRALKCVSGTRFPIHRQEYYQPFMQVGTSALCIKQLPRSSEESFLGASDPAPRGHIKKKLTPAGYASRATAPKPAACKVS